MTRWRQRLGEAEFNALLQESLAVALKTRALKPADLDKVIVDTTVQEKAVAFPTDARLMTRARERLVRLAKRHGLTLRQSYVRVGKFALIKHQRYRHAKHFKRAKACLRKIKTQLGRVVRDIERNIAGRPELNAVFRAELYKATRVATQRPRDGRRHIYALHAPEVECIGKGKAHKPYEFGVKVSVATTLERSRGGQFVVHVKTLPHNPYDGHTLAEVIPGIEAISGASLKRIIADAGYRGHNAPMPYKLRVFTAGQKRRMTPEIKRRMRRRSAVEPVIGHLKADHRMDRNHLAHTSGDVTNPILAAIGYNFRRVLTWLKLLRAFIAAVRYTLWMYPIRAVAMR
jgi:IS5 family transposase